MRILLSSLLLFPLCGFAAMEDQLISSQDLILTRSSHLPGWIDDFTLAKRVAQQKKQPMLIAFLGPSWCSYSDKLEEEILSNQNFLGVLKEKLVLVKVDLSSDSEENSLAKQYHIDECPALILVDAEGKQIAKLEELPLKPQEFTQSIQELVTDYVRMDTLSHTERMLKSVALNELKQLYERAGKFADLTFKKILLKQGLKVDKSPYFLLEEYGNLIAQGHLKTRESRRIRNKIRARDPKNELGAQRKLAILDFEALSHVIHQPKHAHTVVHPILHYLRKFGKEDKENSWKLELMVSRYLFSKTEVKEALKHAMLSWEMAPEGKRAEIEESIQYLKTQLHS